MLRKGLTSFICTLLLAAPAIAHDYQIGQLHIAHPWARALPPVAPAGAAYLRVENRGEASDTLIAAHTPIAERVEVHQHVQRDGLMSMQKVGDLSIGPGEDVAFEPGGYHLMMLGLKQPLVAGERFPLTLEFRNAGSIEVDFAISEAAPVPAGHDPKPSASEANQHHHH